MIRKALKSNDYLRSFKKIMIELDRARIQLTENLPYTFLGHINHISSYNDTKCRHKSDF